MIRKSEKNVEDGKLEMKVDKGQKEFLELAIKFFKQKGLANRYNENNVGSSDGKLFTAWSEGKLLSANVYTATDDTLFLVSIISQLPFMEDKEKIISNANKALIWEAIKYAKSNGLTNLDIGGILPASYKSGKRYEGISHHKTAFGGKTMIKFNYFKSYSAILNACRGFVNANIDLVHKMKLYNLPFKGLGAAYHGADVKKI